MINHIIYRRPIYDGILIGPSFGCPDIEWGLITDCIWCGVPRSLCLNRSG